MKNQKVRLIARPLGISHAEHFSLVTEPVAAPGKGEILIHNQSRWRALSRCNTMRRRAATRSGAEVLRYGATRWLR
jgi:NADPH-dependent curcumin reductase CurA